MYFFLHISEFTCKSSLVTAYFNTEKTQLPLTTIIIGIIYINMSTTARVIKEYHITSSNSLSFYNIHREMAKNVDSSGN